MNKVYIYSTFVHMSFGAFNNEIGCEKIADHFNYVTKREVLSHFRAVCAEDLIGVAKSEITKEAISLTADIVLHVFVNMGHDAVLKSNVVS